MTDRRAEIEALLEDSGHKRHWGRWLAMVAVLAGLVGGGWYLSGEAGAVDQTSARYMTDPVTRADLIVTITATGTVEPQGVVEISSELSGTLTEVLVGFNETVRAGQVLARLDTVKLEAELAVQSANLAAAEANLNSARTTLDEARDSYETTESLHDRGLVIHSTYESAQAAWKRAEAAVQVAEANRDLAQANYDAQLADLDKAEIVSPIDGVVLDVAAEPGQIVAASLSAPVLFTIAEDLAKMELQAAVAEADIGQVTDGDAATFTVEAYDTATFPAVISQVRYASSEEDGLVSYTAILTVDNPDLRLRPGMTAVADIVVAEATDVMTVANAALRYAQPVADLPVAEAEAGAAGDEAARPDGPGANAGIFSSLMPRRPEDSGGATTIRADGLSVWVLRDGVPVRVEVTPGATDGSRTEISSEALEPGDAVITSRLAGA